MAQGCRINKRPPKGEQTDDIYSELSMQGSQLPRVAFHRLNEGRRVGKPDSVFKNVCRGGVGGFRYILIGVVGIGKLEVN